ncbi:MAG TPA: endopeptidase La, partial [Proteobacteria bacterium]|nr:endopeptidase La [Pseudomonadota bacterium]
MVVFPYTIEPLFVGRKKSISTVEESLRKDNLILLAAQIDGSTENPLPTDIYSVGCVGKILQFTRTRDGAFKILVEGLYRAKTKQFLPSTEYFLAYTEKLTEDVTITMDTQNLIRVLLAVVEEYLKFKRDLPPTLVATLSAIENPGRLADTLVKYIKELSTAERQGLLETLNATERLSKIYRYLKTIVEKLSLESKIKSRMRKGQERGGMEPPKLGMPGQEEFKSDLEELEEAIKRKKMPVEVTEKVWSEFRKLKLMSPLSAEATVVRNYIDTILSLPWYERSEEKLDIKEAARILDEDHYGLKNVKERILEYLAVRALVDKMRGPILCFVGPPGVGKTSLGRSIARATGRKFVRVSLGGVRDEAEIRGHRRTYIGSMPGKIILGMKRAGVKNPVFLLDEVDKMSSDWRGDPASALLEVLDPEQNHTFQDHYIEVDYDLSEVMFITTANTMHGIPPPLLDRMEVIRLPGYTEEEQLEIAKHFLVKKQREMHGLTEDEIRFTDKALLTIIRSYTREAGVRNLEREIASICRKVGREVIESGERGRMHKITPKLVRKYLGVPRFRHGKIEDRDLIGLCTGLAWTEAGGEILVTEVTVMPGKGKVLTTGKLGDVMQESAQAALSYIRSRSIALGIDPGFYQKVDIHIHVPEGAIPK